MTKDEERINKTLSDRAAIVTGSTSGIGLAIARALAGSGANVVLNGFGDLKEIEKIRISILNEFGTAVIYVPADMAQPTDIVRLIETTEETFGRIDILVNNAGVQHVAAIETFPVEKWDQILAINLSSAFHTIRRVILDDYSASSESPSAVHTQ
jgi:3-hydroxybutyrate dehydrogenase